MDTIVDIDRIDRISRRTDARDVALAAYDQLIGFLDSLEGADWTAPTECARWTVADMVGHVLGAAEAGASMRMSLRQMRTGRRRRKDFDDSMLDALNEFQVETHRGLSPAERVTTLRELAPRAVRGRMRTPAPVRAIRMPVDTTGSMPQGSPTTVTIGQAMDTVYTRDAWLHTVDIARATGRQFDPSAPVNRRIIEDAVAEWGKRHGRPVTLELTGPAGGVFRQGSGGERLSYDAVEFCRALSGRAPAEGLLATRVLF